MRTLSKQITMFIIACSVTLAANAQVTIGAGIEPAKGALLDLKDHSPGTIDKTTANKGLLLPRVNLTNLKPTDPTGTNGLPASIGSPATENWDLEAHIGLVVFNVNQCAGSEQIQVGSFVWSGTEWEFLGQEDIASGVKYNAGKSGTYEGFWSAKFGDAGEWMTTNLTAWAYDGNAHPYFPLTQSATHSSDQPYWSYPDGGADGLDMTSYTANPHLGLLYNWSAATAGKGGSTGQENPGNEGGDGTYAHVQGICPTGWHLPSDYEWTKLENEIITNTTKYASVSSNIGSPLLSLDDKTTYGQRGTTHGQAMKSPCPTLLSSNSDGLSKTIQQNGLGALLAGYADNGSTNLYGSYGSFWSASSYTDITAWSRAMLGSSSQVNRAVPNRATLFSVRCKKD